MESNVKKTYDTVGGIDEFDRAHAEALDLLRKIVGRNDVPKAFLAVVPTTDPNGKPALETIYCCSPEHEAVFLSMIVETVSSLVTEVTEGWEK